MGNIAYGWKPSQLDGSEQKFDVMKNFNIPEEYSYIDYLPPVENQGQTNMCVTYSLAAHLDWNCNVDSGMSNNQNNHIDKKEIYSVRTIPGDNGMSFKEALNFLKKQGVKSDYGKLKIEKYAMVRSFLALKQALLLNGPCVGGLMVKNPQANDFWNGNQNYGGHAIAIVGYTKNGFVIRNSWGPRYGKDGYWILPYNEFNKILECWTIID